MKEDSPNTRLLALLADKHLPESEKLRLMEGIVDKKITVTDAEYETASQRVRREGREEGREEGRKEGREEGRRAILALAARVVPEDLPALSTIKDIDELQRAAEDAFARKLRS